MNLINYVFTGLAVCCFVACKNQETKYIPDVSDTKVNLNLIRFDRELLKLDTQNIRQSLSSLIANYPAFSSLYFNQIVAFPQYRDTLNDHFVTAVMEFIKDPVVIEINQLVQKTYPDDKFLETELHKSLQFMKYYFPQENEPAFYTLISEFSYGNFIFQNAPNQDGIGISLDFFLGGLFDYKKIDPDNPMFSDYLNRCFNKDHLLKKTWEVWLEDKLGVLPNGRFIDFMLQEGKKLYVLEKILPAIQDTVLFEYTPAQLNWCRQNKREIWSFFLTSNLLYSTELQKFNKYINPSPVSPGMPPEAPGKTGRYTGYEIIKAFIKRHPDISLTELLDYHDSQKLLTESNYKPRND